MDNNKEGEITQIKKRLEYLITTDEISDSEKVAIVNIALMTIKKCEVEREVQ